ncbi:hypothetical protein J7L24_00150, partial [bacterium]|nr:hypothetical protein [bacterium]
VSFLQDCSKGHSRAIKGYVFPKIRGIYLFFWYNFLHRIFTSIKHVLPKLMIKIAINICFNSQTYILFFSVILI